MVLCIYDGHLNAAQEKFLSDLKNSKCFIARVEFIPIPCSR